MNLEKLALSLGLPKESDEAAVVLALSKRDAEGRAAVESLASVAQDLPKFGIKLDGKSLVRLAPVPVELSAKEGDSEETKALKGRALAAEKTVQLSQLLSMKERIQKLALSLKVGPALLPTVERLAGVRGELEVLMLSKDGKDVELTKSKDFGAEFVGVLEQLSSMGGVKFPAPDGGKEAKTDEEKASAEREKLAKEILARTQPQEEPKKS